MGLGLHGGGLATSKFLINNGAVVTVTDLKSEKDLYNPLTQIGNKARLVLGSHEESDFTKAEMILKNPSVPYSSPYLQKARTYGIPIETDISLFRNLHSDNPLLVVTGSKGKSTTVAALHRAIQAIYPKAKLGGNSFISPLEFSDDLTSTTPVILELSSWQLGDLPLPEILKPKIAIFTNLYRDHLDSYPSMFEYARDKELIFKGQSETDHAVIGPGVKNWLKKATIAKKWNIAETILPTKFQGAFINNNSISIHEEISNDSILICQKPFLSGSHNLLNLATASLGAIAFSGYDDLSAIRSSVESFKGLPHRTELVAEHSGIRFINDSAATIPAALKASVNSQTQPTILISGGQDKNLDFSVLDGTLSNLNAAILLEGSATQKLINTFRKNNIKTYGPFSGLEDAISTAL